MQLFRRIAPIRDATRFTNEYWEVLKSEFRFHKRIAEIACIAGLIGGLFLPFAVTGNIQSWDIGFGFAMMAALPLGYVLTICSLMGFEETYQRWSDFSTMEYAIPWKVQLCVYLAIIALGLACLVGRSVLPHDIREPPNETRIRGSHAPFPGERFTQLQAG